MKATSIGHASYLQGGADRLDAGNCEKKQLQKLSDSKLLGGQLIGASIAIFRRLMAHVNSCTQSNDCNL